MHTSPEISLSLDKASFISAYCKTMQFILLYCCISAIPLLSPPCESMLFNWNQMARVMMLCN